MRPNGIALFEGDNDAKERIIDYLKAKHIGTSIVSAATWGEAKDIIENTKRLGINLFVINSNLAPHKNNMNRTKNLVLAIRELQIVPPPAIIYTGFEPLQRHDARMHLEGRSTPFPPTLAIAITQVPQPNTAA